MYCVKNFVAYKSVTGATKFDKNIYNGKEGLAYKSVTAATKSV